MLLRQVPPAGLDVRVEPSAIAPGRGQRVLMVVIAVATFGPYVVGSIRTEQLVVYGLLVLTLPFALPRLQTRGGLRLLVPWALYALVASLSLLPGPSSIAPYPAGSLLAGYDNVLLPLAILLLVWTLVPAERALVALRAFAAAVAVGAAANAVLAMIGVVVDLSPLLRPFWTGDGSDSVAVLAAELGRLGGVFNQPVEAGIVYGIGGLCAVYVWRERPVLLATLVAIITIGGLLSVSKAFILGAMPFVLLAWLWSQRGHRRVVALLVGLLALLAVLQSGLVERWAGFDYLTRLLDPSGGLLDFYSAGRFAERSTFSEVVDAALAHSPLVGVGPGGWAVAYDGAVAEALVVAGVLGLALYAATMLGILSLARTGGEEGRFALLLGIVVLGGCLGFSPLTANRVATIVWVLAALLVLVRAHRQEAPAETTKAALVTRTAFAKRVSNGA
ncbi:hypothetical protein [Agrococcus sp. SGAir0287]|uniref:hypothetical protein n=1 Tax=Agrococcus sp. SGAir0287 TaxID=2070347 RepID=UPI0010CD303E|nr:hypothetical protein [Agrococcus sp. SGAir0287]QCR19028.1 hypothetical protein C1N71_05875 [Agrococcus sp. SGAir0287]